MRRRWFGHLAATSASPAGLPVSRIDQLVAVLRLATIGLFFIGHDYVEAGDPTAFHALLAAYAFWSLALLVWSLHAPREGIGWAATVVDVAAITALIAATQGPASYARYGYFLIPVSVAFRFRPILTAVSTLAAVIAYLVQANRVGDEVLPGLEAAYMGLVGLACTTLSWVLRRYVNNITSLAEARASLLADALEAEDRERQTLAETLHDHAIQNLLAARHALQGAIREHHGDERLQAADASVMDTVQDLRETVFQMHPYVLDEAGLDTALRRTLQQLQARTGVVAELSGSAGERAEHSRLLFGVARELVSNVAKHANAQHIRVELSRQSATVTMRVVDDGDGFEPAVLAERLADGHIGLASQRVRIEAVGGRLDILTQPGEGTAVTVAVPTT